MDKFIFVFFLIPICVFSQIKKETYFSEKGLFCSIEVTNNDTIWKFGQTSFQVESTDSLVMSVFIKYDCSKSFRFGNVETDKISYQDFEFETKIVDNDYYRRKFGVLSSRFVFILLENGDNFLRKSNDHTRDSVVNWYNGVLYFLSFVRNDRLQFLTDQFSLLNSGNDFSSLAKKCFEEKDYELALFYSKLFLIQNDVNSESDMEIAMIFDLSNVAFELNNKYALIHPENEVLRKLIYQSADAFPRTYMYQIVE